MTHAEHRIVDALDRQTVALTSLLDAIRPLLPSQDDKTPPSPDSAPNSGTSEPIDTERWNWTVVDGAWWVCRRDHEKYEACEYSPATPEEIASAGKGEPPLMP